MKRTRKYTAKTDRTEHVFEAESFDAASKMWNAAVVGNVTVAWLELTAPSGEVRRWEWENSRGGTGKLVRDDTKMLEVSP